MNSNNLAAYQNHFAAEPVSKNYVESLVGNTPLLAIHFHFNGKRRTIFAKAEHLNLTGSIKDRMALHIISTAYRDGLIKNGDTIVEATSGNTGISFAAIGHAFGNPVHIFIPNWMSKERISLIESYGARVTLVSHEQGGFLGSIEMCERRGAIWSNGPYSLRKPAMPPADRVRMGPAEMALTRIPSGPRSAAR